MEAYFVLVLAGLTSLAAGALEWRRHSRPGPALRAAMGRASETVGLSVLFFLANVATGALVTVAARLLDVGFVSIYLSTDIALLVLSLLQALVFQGWREARSERD
jgi:hypothetical protein